MVNENWESIHEDFGKKGSGGVTYQQFWESFTYQEAKYWIKIGLIPSDYNLAYFLKKDNYYPSNLNQKDLEQLRKKYAWKNIHEGFSFSKRKEWEKKGFNYQETKFWIEIGFKPWDLDQVLEWKKEFTLEQIKDLTKAGLNSKDIDYAKWLRDIKQVDSNWVLQHITDIQELKAKYRLYGSCKKCKQLNTKYDWCWSCDSSANQTIDEFIQEHKYKGLKWIPYKEFANIKHLADGGFSKVYKATWFYTESRSSGTKEVVLKSLNNSQEVVADFLREIASHNLFRGNQIVQCIGVSQEPTTRNYLMVIDYVPNGNLRQYLKNYYNKLDFKNKIFQLMDIIRGLSYIHEQKMVHRDFHTGNILNHGICNYISDLGLCRPVNEKNSDKVYGVLPYVAPEVLEGKPYTQTSDIYSFGMIVWEMFTGLPPYYDKAHDTDLILQIHDGLRPNLDNVKIPQLLKNLIKQCWDANPENRPNASKLFKVLNGWYKDIFGEIDTTKFYQQYKEIKRVEKFDKNTKYPVYQIHPSAIYTSRLLDTTILRSFLQSRSSLASVNSLNSLDWKSKVNITNDNFKSEKLTLTVETLNKKEYRSLDLDFDIKTNNFTQETKDLTEKTKRQLSLETQTKTNQGESKLTKINENPEYQSEPMEIDYSNWQNLHPNFIPQLQKEWTEWGFTPQTAQEWINTNFIKPTDINYVQWLKNWTWKNPSDINYNTEQNLRKKYSEYLTQNPRSVYQPSDYVVKFQESWRNIHLEFTPFLVQNWEGLGFNYGQCREWINIGLTPEDYNFANFLKKTKNLTPEEVLNNHQAESLKQEFEQSQLQTQIQINLPNK